MSFSPIKDINIFMSDIAKCFEPFLEILSDPATIFIDQPNPQSDYIPHLKNYWPKGVRIYRINVSSDSPRYKVFFETYLSYNRWKDVIGKPDEYESFFSFDFPRIISMFIPNRKTHAD